MLQYIKDFIYVHYYIVGYWIIQTFFPAIEDEKIKLQNDVMNQKLRDDQRYEQYQNDIDAFQEALAKVRADYDDLNDKHYKLWAEYQRLIPSKATLKKEAEKKKPKDGKQPIKPRAKKAVKKSHHPK